MSVEAGVIFVIVNLYLLIYYYKIIKLFKSFYNYEGRCIGEVASESDVKDFKISESEIIRTSMPMYRFILNNKTIKFKGVARYRDLKIGEKVSIAYDEKKEKFLCEKDVVSLKKNLR